MSKGQGGIDGSDPPRFLVQGPGGISEGVERLFLACRSSVLVRAPRLDLDFYSSESFSECCRAIIVRDLRNELLFLVEDKLHLMRSSTRLLALARRFSSYVKIRVAGEEHVEHREMFVVCDRQSYLHQPSVDRAAAFMNTSDRAAAGQLALRFQDLWERSEAPEELFTMGL